MWTAPAIVVAPTVGRLVGRYGTGIFMTAGLLLHAAGLAWIAVAASPQVAYATLVAPLALSGIGIAMVMPTVSAQAVGSVPPSSVGVASGTNSTLRELGGVVGVALVSAVFARPGAYASPTQFTHGFTAALWLAAGLSLVGVMCALAPRTSRETASTELALQR
jgi:MFS family permease